MGPTTDFELPEKSNLREKIELMIESGQTQSEVADNCRMRPTHIHHFLKRPDADMKYENGRIVEAYFDYCLAHDYKGLGKLVNLHKKRKK